MRLGIDVDGVLANFNAAFMDRIVTLTGRDMFPPRPFEPPTWAYPTYYGYSRFEETLTWEGIHRDPKFWLTLDPYWDAVTVLERLRELSTEHDIYFITARYGKRAKQQTEYWLATHSGDFLWNPTVVLSGNKATCAAALEFDRYIDDSEEHVTAVSEKCYGETYLLDRAWNRGLLPSPGITRVSSVLEMLPE